MCIFATVELYVVFNKKKFMYLPKNAAKYCGKVLVLVAGAV